MLSSNKNIESLQELTREVIAYVKLQKRYAQLDIAEKLAVLLATMALSAILFLLGGIVVLFLSYLCVSVLQTYLGSEAAAYAVVCTVWVVVAFVVYAQRKRLIVNPIASFVAKLFVGPEKTDHHVHEHR